MLVRCKTSNHVNKSLQNILEHSGEGIILRERGSTYEHGRSRSLIKLKVIKSKEEGKERWYDRRLINFILSFLFS